MCFEDEDCTMCCTGVAACCRMDIKLWKVLESLCSGETVADNVEKSDRARSLNSLCLG